MLTDPITVAAASPTPALTFAVVAYTGEGAERKDVANSFGLKFSHSSNAKTGERHYMQLTQSKSATNTYTGGISLQTASVSLSISIPPFGWTLAEKVAVVQALLDTLNDSEVTITKVLGSQS
jgi:hypothetical protein